MIFFTQAYFFRLWRYEDYGKWASDNCSDPKQLLESIVYKPENVIEWGYFNEFESNEAQFYNNYDYENWYYFDDTDYVPCITLLTNNGMEQIILQLLVNSTINIHTPGMFLQGDGGQRRQHKSINLRDDHELHLDYEYHQLLDVDYGGVPCKKEKEYRKDLCTEKMIEKELIDKIGCTTPFVSNKSQICTEEDRGLQADNLARDLHHVKGSKCANPCSIFSFTTTYFKKSEFWSNGTYLRIKIKFPKNIKVFERSYTYSRLSLLAEIGGYVGLFLGISINQAINLLENLVAKLQFICRHFSIIQMINLLDSLFTKLQWINQHHLRF